jgi:ATP-dependent DNA helicase RecG
LRSDTCHVLDVTATAIPRTQALAQVGLITTVHLREGHSKKNVATRLWQREEMRELFVSVRKTIEDGARVLVVYPAISTSKSANGLRSIEDAIDKWESNFKGLVRVVNGKLKSGEKAANLKDIVDGTARIGICTSAIEVGINIPNLRQVVVVGPDRFGLTTLHQLRGRLAREGGRGHFDMLLLDKASADTLERLQVLEKVTDGYELAEADLRLRGPGELKANGKRQSGGSLSALYGREVKPEHLLEMEPVLRKWLSRSDTRAEMET